MFSDVYLHMVPETIFENFDSIPPFKYANRKATQLLEFRTLARVPKTARQKSTPQNPQGHQHMVPEFPS